MKTDVSKRRLIWATIAMFSLAGCVAGGFFYLNQRATAQTLGPPADLDAVYILQPDGTLAPPRNQVRAEQALQKIAIERAGNLREKFRPWALKHKSLIQTMLDAQPHDESALWAVYRAVPLNSKVAGFEVEDFSAKRTPAFSWGFVERAISPARYAKLSPQMKKGIEFGQKIRRENFRDYRDIYISDSVNSGPVGVRLWVSGRITQYDLVQGRRRRQNYSGFNEAEVEIVPPYSFLKSNLRIDTETGHKATR
jgi:hypothetical protein